MFKQNEISWLWSRW